MLTTILLAVLLGQGPRTPLTRLPGPYSKESAELRAVLNQGVRNYDLRADNFADALVQVAGRFKIPMGVEWFRGPAEMGPVHLSWNDATVGQVVRDIANTQPGYEVRVKDAVLHVRPHAFVPGQRNFLWLEVPEFQVEQEVAEIASKQLGQSLSRMVVPPEPSTASEAAGGMGRSQGVEVGDPEISMNLTNVTAEDVLDGLIMASPFKIWVVTFAGDQSATPSRFTRTVSPVTGKPVPDEDQPTWELVRWGRMPY